MMSSAWRAPVVVALVVGTLAVTDASTQAAELPLVVPGVGSVLEGDAGMVVLEVPVSLSAPSTETVTVEWSVLFGAGVEPPDPAVPGVDFVAVPEVVTFAPGDTEEVVEVSVVGDTDFEADEYVVASFHSPTNAVIGGFYGLGFGVIENDDVVPPRSLSLTPASGLNGGDTVLVHGVGWTPGANIAMCQAFNDTSITPPQNACLADNVPLVMFSADALGAFSVEAEARRWGYVPGVDAFVDCTEPVPGCLFGAGETADAGTITTTPFTLATPPPPPAIRGTLVVSPSDDLVDGDPVLVSGSGFRPNQDIDVYQCTTEPNVQGPLGCDWTTRIVDSTDASGSFAAFFDVARTVQGVDCTAATCFLAAAEAVDFEGTYVAEPITFAPAAMLIPGDVSVVEGDVGSTLFTVPVGLSEPVGGIVTIDWATVVLGSPEPEATPGDDYTSATGTVSFPAGEVATELEISVIGDPDIEPDEVVWIRFSDPVNATIGADDLGSLTIEDDDTLPILEPSSDVWSEPEVPESYGIVFQLLGSTPKTISVQWETVVLGPEAPPSTPEATPGEDYVAASGTVVYPPGGPVGGDYHITLLPDTIPEPEEAVWHRFFDPVNAVLGTDFCLPDLSIEGCVVGLFIDDYDDNNP